MTKFTVLFSAKMQFQASIDPTWVGLDETVTVDELWDHLEANPDCLLDYTADRYWLDTDID